MVYWPIDSLEVDSYFRWGWLNGISKDKDSPSLSAVLYIAWLYALALCNVSTPALHHSRKSRLFHLRTWWDKSNSSPHILFTPSGHRKETQPSFMITRGVDQLVSWSQSGSTLVHPYHWLLPNSEVVNSLKENLGEVDDDEITNKRYQYFN